MASDSSYKSDKYRSFMYGDGEKDTQWRLGAPPNYDIVNKLFEEERTQEWAEGSMEERVQRLVKSWEMEIFHKPRPEDCKTFNPEKFRFSVNGGKSMTTTEIRQIGGGYNAFLQTNLPEDLRIYDPTKETAESAQKTFTTTFPRGFAVEILNVYSGPPVIVYKFRHWAYMEGPFKGHAPTGEKIEFFGIGIFTVDEEMKIEKVEFFYDPSQLLAGFLKGATEENKSQVLSCPFINTTSK